MHYVFGMAADFGGKPWSWVHHASVLSAVKVNKGAEILFWYEHEPTGRWWQASRRHLTLRKIRAPRTICGNEIHHPAHAADVVRLRALIEHGGVYIDSDVWCLTPFANLKHCGFFMGIQGASYGLCNATIGGDAGSPFARRWLNTYRTFRSKGRDAWWDEHSVRVPMKLYREDKTDITVYPSTKFFTPLWGGIRSIFQPVPRKVAILRKSTSVHLWESICWPWLRRLNPDTIPRTCEIAKRLEEIGVL